MLANGQLQTVGSHHGGFRGALRGWSSGGAGVEGVNRLSVR
jgi:hypothetical protein